MKFAYTAFDLRGKGSAGVVEAGSQAEAGQSLRRQGLLIATLAPTGSGGGAGAALGVAPGGAAPGQAAGSINGASAARSAPLAPTVVSRARRVSARKRLAAVSGFAGQMSILVQTGTPLVDALTSLERQTPAGPWRDTLADVRTRVEQGDSLSGAMAAHPGYFDAVARALVAAGESGGKLDAILGRLAKLTRQQQKVHGAVAHAMVYPCLLIVVAVVVVVTMIAFVMPRFEDLFKTLDVALPPSTKLLMAASHVLVDYWWAIVPGAAVAVAAVVFAAVSERTRPWRDRLLLRTPMLGKVLCGLITARVLRVLGVLVEGRVPLLDALRLTRAAAGNQEFAKLIDRSQDAIIRGEPMSSAFGNSPLVTPSVAEAVRSAERSGQIAPVMLTVADALDEDNESAVKTVTSLLEPLILIVLGVIVGVMAVSMFLPLFDLTAAAAPPPAAGASAAAAVMPGGAP